MVEKGKLGDLACRVQTPVCSTVRCVTLGTFSDLLNLVSTFVTGIVSEVYCCCVVAFIVVVIQFSDTGH